MSEDMPNTKPEIVSEDMPVRMSERMAEDMPNRIPERMSEDVRCAASGAMLLLLPRNPAGFARSLECPESLTSPGGRHDGECQQRLG